MDNDDLKGRSYYFPDLVPYQFADAEPHQRVRRVGWIEVGNAFKTGDVAVEVVSKLDAIKSSRWPILFHFGLIRGAYRCTLCLPGNRFACSTELLIPDADRPGCYFGSLAMIDHFIRDHRYVPPDEFQRSVLAVDLSRPFDAVVAYDTARLSEAAMRAAYEVRARSLLGAGENPEVTRYRRWLEEHGFPAPG